MSIFPIAILAGGLATRLHPLTLRTPKALLAMCGRPFIFHQLDLLHGQGLRDVVLCLGHLGEQIQSAVGDGAQFDLTVRYSFDGPMALGTGGALRRALPLLGENFFVLNGDSYLHCDYDEVQSSYLSCGLAALMTVLRNENQWDRSNVLCRDGKVAAYSKRAPQNDMSYIDFGLSVLSRAAVSARDETAFDLADLCTALAARGDLAAFETNQRFYEIGSLAGIRDTEAHLAARLASA